MHKIYSQVIKNVEILLISGLFDLGNITILDIFVKYSHFSYIILITFRLNVN